MPKVILFDLDDARHPRRPRVMSRVHTVAACLDMTGRLNLPCVVAALVRGSRLPHSAAGLPGVPRSRHVV